MLSGAIVFLLVYYSSITEMVRGGSALLMGRAHVGGSVGVAYKLRG
jgi:hypothetical protein